LTGNVEAIDGVPLLLEYGACSRYYEKKQQTREIRRASDRNGCYKSKHFMMECLDKDESSRKG